MTIDDGALVGNALRLLPSANVGPGNTNILLLGDGYLRGQLGANGLFAQHCRELVAHITNERWYRPELRLNIYSQEARSTDQGADIAAGCGVLPLTVKTYFDSIHGGGGLCRLLTGADATVATVASAVADSVLGLNAEFDAVIVLVNSATYGASSYQLTAWVSAGYPGPENFADMALHELGHVAALFDEYGYRSACNDKNKTWCGKPHIAANVDKSPTSPQWVAKVTPGFALPTLSHPGRPACLECYDPPDAVLGPFGSGVGTFEGSGWFHCGLYRPSAHCKMRNVEDPFCTVCVRELLRWLA